jgi:fatty acid synthase
LVKNDIEAGIIKPLNTTVFNASDVEEAFRFMANGKHIGKVLLKIRDEVSHNILPLIPLNRCFWNANESIIIIGGLGGFGLELAKWMIIRGCRKFVLSSRRGVTKDKQHHKLS